MKLSRGIATMALTIGLAITGATAAQAWTWATSSAPLTMTGGGGYGTTAFQSYAQGNLVSTLKDTVLDGERVYVSLYGTYGSNSSNTESGRRADGGSAYARMADKSIISPYPYGVNQFFYTLRLCRDRAGLPDACSDAYRTNQGL